MHKFKGEEREILIWRNFREFQKTYRLNLIDVSPSDDGILKGALSKMEKRP